MNEDTIQALKDCTSNKLLPQSKRGEVELTTLPASENVKIYWKMTLNNCLSKTNSKPKTLFKMKNG